MRTTLDIDERLLDDVVKAVGVKGKSKAVEEALRLYLRGWAVKRLAELAGTIDLIDNREEFRRADARREEWLDQIRTTPSEQHSVSAG